MTSKYLCAHFMYLDIQSRKNFMDRKVGGKV